MNNPADKNALSRRTAWLILAFLIVRGGITASSSAILAAWSLHPPVSLGLQASP